MDDKIKKLSFALMHAHVLPQRVRFFFIHENLIIRCLGNDVSISSYAEEFGFSQAKRLDRGEVLGIFAKLEFLVNECLRIYFLGIDSTQSNDFDELLKSIDFERRVRLLLTYKIINRSMADKIHNLTSVRNKLAHEWDETAVTYLKKPLKREQFEKFQEHLKSAFKGVVESYQRLQNEHNFGNYIDGIITRIDVINKETK